MLNERVIQSGEIHLYNEDIKETFLNEYPEGTRQTYRRIFVRSTKVEQELGKDLYNFDTEQIRRMLQSLNPITFASARTNGRIVSAYLNWAVTLGKRETGVNPLLDTHTEWYEQFVKNPTSRYITDAQLQLVEGDCANFQDSIIFRLVFEGIQGKAVSEITNLRKKDFSQSRSTVTVNRNGKRESLPVSEDCIFGLIHASAEEIYKKNNGDFRNLPDNVREWTELVDNDYVLRNSNIRKDKLDENAPIDKHTVYRRIDLIRDRFEEGELDFLAVKNISKSGMIWYARKLMPEYGGKLTKELYERVAERYNIKGWWRLQEWCNEDVIREVYGEQ